MMMRTIRMIGVGMTVKRMGIAVGVGTGMIQRGGVIVILMMVISMGNGGRAKIGKIDAPVRMQRFTRCRILRIVPGKGDGSVDGW
jgi:hypothetical protein